MFLRRLQEHARVGRAIRSFGNPAKSKDVLAPSVSEGLPHDIVFDAENQSSGKEGSSAAVPEPRPEGSGVVAVVEKLRVLCVLRG